MYGFEVDNSTTRVDTNCKTRAWLHGESRRVKSFSDHNSSSQPSGSTQPGEPPQRASTTPIVDFTSKQSLRTRSSPLESAVKRCRFGAFTRRVHTLAWPSPFLSCLVGSDPKTFLTLIHVGEVTSGQRPRGIDPLIELVLPIASVHTSRVPTEPFPHQDDQRFAHPHTVKVPSTVPSILPKGSPQNAHLIHYKSGSKSFPWDAAAAAR